jgi:hypothetical protein
MLTRDDILARKLGHGKHQLSDGSGEVAIRALTHGEATESAEARGNGDVSLATAIIIHHGLTDPALSLEDVQAWMTSDDGGTLENLAQAIGRLSHLFEGAPKSGV